MFFIECLVLILLYWFINTGYGTYAVDAACYEVTSFVLDNRETTGGKEGPLFLWFHFRFYANYKDSINFTLNKDYSFIVTSVFEHGTCRIRTLPSTHMISTYYILKEFPPWD